MTLECPQTDNKRGPHSLTFKAAPDKQSDGDVILRVGGKLMSTTYSDSLEIVGTKENEASKELIVTKDYVVKSKNFIYIADKNVFMYAKEKIFLMAGQDCPQPSPDQDTEGPCFCPVIVYQGGKKGGVLKISDRVFAAASLDSNKVQLQMVMGGK